MNAKHLHVAFYGNVQIMRAFCLSCESNAMVLDGELQCCGEKADFGGNSLPKKPQTKAIRIVEPEQKRRSPSKALKEKIIAEQHNKCYYCEVSLESWVSWRNKRVKLVTHFDHKVPFSYAQNNSNSNFVAACHHCNLTKSNLMFDTVEEARAFILPIVTKKRWSVQDALEELTRK